jgi:hypothetical protein
LRCPEFPEYPDKRVVQIIAGIYVLVKMVVAGADACVGDDQVRPLLDKVMTRFAIHE